MRCPVEPYPVHTLLCRMLGTDCSLLPKNVPLIVSAYTDSFLIQFIHEMPVIGTFLLAIKYKDGVKFLLSGTWPQDSLIPCNFPQSRWLMFRQADQIPNPSYTCVQLVVNVDLWQSSPVCSLFPLPPGLVAISGFVPKTLWIFKGHCCVSKFCASRWVCEWETWVVACWVKVLEGSCI